MEELQKQWRELRQREDEGEGKSAPVETATAFVAWVFKFKHNDKLNEYWVVEVNSDNQPTAVKRICNY